MEGVVEARRRGNIFVQSKEGGVFVASIITTMFCVSFMNFYWKTCY